MDDRGVMGVNERRVWRAVQAAVWLIGVWIILALVLWPKAGINALWNILIPIAPAVLVLLTGVWRNVCPIATTALFPRSMGWRGKWRISTAWHGRLSLIGTLALLVLVPLRHIVLDASGPATALTLCIIGVCAVLFGLLFEGKSGWCSGLCPVHPVEKFYGYAPLVTARNLHCHTCEQCVTPCPDSTPTMHPLKDDETPSGRLASTLFVGGFPGFVWAWFHLNDYSNGEGWSHLGLNFGVPLAGLAVTLGLYLLLRRWFLRGNPLALVRIFATAAVVFYYWYRIPPLFGFGPYSGGGTLIDLTHVLPAWFPTASHLTTTTLFLWLMLGRNGRGRSWALRPPLEPGLS